MRLPLPGRPFLRSLLGLWLTLRTASLLSSQPGNTFYRNLGQLLVTRFQAAFAWFIVASALRGLGYTFYSSAVETWLVDALEFTKFRGILDHVFARAAFVLGAAMLISQGSLSRKAQLRTVASSYHSGVICLLNF